LNLDCKNLVRLIKDRFAWSYQRYSWGYGILHTPIGLFNFFALFSIVAKEPLEAILGFEIRNLYLFIFLGGTIFIGFTMFGWFMYDKLKINTDLTKHGGMNNAYWTHRLTPLSQKTQLMLLDCLEHPEKIKGYKEKVRSGYL
jgi:hypothetical protein